MILPLSNLNPTNKQFPKLFQLLDMKIHLLFRNILSTFIYLMFHTRMFFSCIEASECFLGNLLEYFSDKGSLSVYLVDSQPFRHILKRFPKRISICQSFWAFPSTIFVTVIRNASKFKYFFAFELGF